LIELVGLQERHPCVISLPSEVSVAKPYPRELRERVVSAYEDGEGSFVELGRRFKIGEATVNRWVSRKRSSGDVAPKPMGGSRGFLVDEVGERLIRSMLEALPDLTLVEVCEAYLEQRGVAISPQTMSDTVRRLGFRRKRGSFVRTPPREPMSQKHGKRTSTSRG
jgi:transposase